MGWFNKLPGFVRSAPGWEHRVWRRLPAVGWWGTVLPLLIAARALQGVGAAAMMALTMARSSASVLISRTKDWSILSL